LHAPAENRIPSALYRARRFMATRRLILLAAAAGVALCLMVRGLRSAEAQPRPSLFVYLPTEAKSSLVESTLQERLPNLNVTVFGRFTDFEDAMNKRKPDAVLGLHPLLAILKTAVALQGLYENNERQPYVLLSASANVEGSLSGRTIGVVDLLGRAGTQDFVSRLLKTPDVRLNLVTKMEDLLPLLQFYAADGVLVPTAAVNKLKQRSRLTLRVRALEEALIGLPAVGLINPAVRPLLVGQFQALDPSTNRMLGVDQWRLP
jgi:hypothetical protein